MSLKQYLIAKIVIAISYPIAKIPIKQLRWLGRKIGRILYYLIPNYRKKALANVESCPMLKIDPKDRPEFVKQVFENLGIVMLEYFLMAHIKDPSSIVFRKGEENVLPFLEKGRGVIFWNGHQANWEIAFLDGCRYFKGFAIGKSQSNPYLYQWILKTRQRFGGVIVSPRNVSLKAIKAINDGLCVGIVGDQADLRHGIWSTFLGKNASTSPLAAILSYKTGAPIILVTTVRSEYGYIVDCHEPLFADRSLPQERAILETTDRLLQKFEKSILEHPTEWLWIHNRWKTAR